MSFEPIDVPYQSPLDREEADKDKSYFYLSPFKAQRIIFELIRINWLNNDPGKDGFRFEQRYSLNEADSSVFLGIAYDWKANPIQKRPCVIVRRNDAGYSSPVMNQTVYRNPVDSEKIKKHIVQMQADVVCIAPNIGFSEELAEYNSRCLLQYEEQIQNDFKFRKFRMAGISTPQLYPESKDHFATVIRVETAFDTNAMIFGDDLKLKTVSTQIFLNLQKPLTEQ